MAPFVHMNPPYKCPCGHPNVPSDPPALDMERLARSMATLRWGWLGWTDAARQGNAFGDDDERRLEAYRNAAHKVAAEYARLSAQPEAQPAEGADGVER